MHPQRIGVVITTYNSPIWLRKVLVGYEAQTFQDFQVLIADDGSDEATRHVIDEFRQRGHLRIHHEWHPDRGYRKCSILNKVVSVTSCDYLIFTDGDCVPAPDFVAIHAQRACPGTFLSGGYIKLPLSLSQSLSDADIAAGHPFERDWLIEQGQPKNHKLWKLTRSRRLQGLLNQITPARTTWNGMNSSTWTREIIAVNGFNEDMQYGGLDREFGERLRNHGLAGRQIRYSAVCLHLDHPRPYADPEARQRNDAIRREVRRQGVCRATNGLERHYRT